MPGYETKQERIAVAGVEHLHIRSLLDRQQFADPLGLALRLRGCLARVGRVAFGCGGVPLGVRGGLLGDLRVALGGVGFLLSRHWVYRR